MRYAGIDTDNLLLAFSYRWHNAVNGGEWHSEKVLAILLRMPYVAFFSTPAAEGDKLVSLLLVTREVTDLLFIKLIQRDGTELRTYSPSQ